MALSETGMVASGVMRRPTPVERIVTRGTRSCNRLSEMKYGFEARFARASTNLISNVCDSLISQRAT